MTVHENGEIYSFFPPHAPLPVKEGNIVRMETLPCFGCKKTSYVLMWKPDFDSWQSGKNVQAVFPWMPGEMRELLITGVHPDCWDINVPDNLEEEGDDEV